ncbi:type VI secretion system contractile sheath small subunit [Methylobacterium mesophilicum]
MMADSSQKFIKRNRPPRVHITYEDPYDAERKVELPFVMGVLADLSGNASKVEKPEMADRDFLEYDMDNFEKRMAAVGPAARFNVEDRLTGSQDKMSVELHFRKMDDFGPAAVARQVPALAKLLEAREQLSNLLRYMDGKVAASDQIKALLKDPALMEALAQRLVPAAPPESSES